MSEGAPQRVGRFRARTSPPEDTRRAPETPKAPVEFAVTAEDEYDGPDTLSPELDIRVRQIGDTGNNQVQKEFLKQQIFTLKMGGMPTDQIAQKLNISIHKCRRLMTEVTKEAAEEWRKKDGFQLVGTAMMRYDTIIREAMQMALTNNDWKAKKAGFEILLKAQGDAIRLADVGGIFIENPLRPKGDPNEEEAAGANALREVAMTFLRGGFSDVDEDEADEEDVQDEAVEKKDDS